MNITAMSVDPQMIKPERTLSEKAAYNIYGVRQCSPFLQDCLSSEMSSLAAHALDVIEEHAGLEADLDSMLTVLQKKASGKMRWARVLGYREEFIIFRDLSMLAFREDLISETPEDLMPERVDALKEELQDSLRRSTDYREDEMRRGLLPITLLLDLGFHQVEPSGIVLKLLVEGSREGGESLKLVCREGSSEDEFISPVSRSSLSDALRGIMDDAEEMVEHARAAALELPPIQRPLEADMIDFDLDRYEETGLWHQDGQLRYWPPYLSRPCTSADDLDDVISLLRDLGDLALWADRDLPEEMTLTLFSCLTYDEAPYFSYTLPNHLRWGAQGEHSAQVFKILQESFESIFKDMGADFPIGHRTGVRSNRLPRGSLGYPVAKIKLQRPSAQRDFEIDDVTPNGFDDLPGFPSIEEQLELEDTLRADPCFGRSDILDSSGTVYAFDQATLTKADLTDIAPFTMTVAGGPQEDTLRTLALRSFGQDAMSEFQEYVYYNRGTGTFTILSSDESDKMLRRPSGFATLTGSIFTDPRGQVGGAHNGRDIISYRVTIDLCAISVHGRDEEAERLRVLASIRMTLGSFFLRLVDQARIRDQHFEVDVHLYSADAVSMGDVEPADEEYLLQSLQRMRTRIMAGSTRDFLSLRDILPGSSVPIF